MSTGPMGATGRAGPQGIRGLQGRVCFFYY